MNYSFMYTFDEEEIFSNCVSCITTTNMDDIIEDIKTIVEEEHEGRSFSDIIGLSVLIKQR